MHFIYNLRYIVLGLNRQKSSKEKRRQSSQIALIPQILTIEFFKWKKLQKIENIIISEKLYRISKELLSKMRRTSVKKSSMFKVQQDKNVYKKYLSQIENCASVRSHPHLFDSIKRTSQTIYNYCYEFADENPFNKGINYGCKTYGLSYPTSNILVIREWVPNAKEVYLLGDFNEFNETSHPMILAQDEKDIYTLELDISKDHINDESRILLKIIDTNGKIHKMPPPSCKIRSNDYGYICIDIEMPATKHQKKNDIILAYTIDLTKIKLSQTLSFIEQNEQILSNFNTIILRSLFDCPVVMDKGTLTLTQMKHLRDVVNKIKNQMGLRIIIQWSLEPGSLKYPEGNPIEKQLLRKEEQGLWHYDISKQQVIALYLANLSYYLSVFQIDGYHFKRIDSFCKDQNGQIIVKCLNIMNSRLHENGFTLASCKKQVPGLNQPILEGGLGFTFTYNYNQNFIQCKSFGELKQRFDKILQSSNCVAINLDQLTQEHELNFLFGVLASGKGIFCKGNLSKDIHKLLQKLFTVRKQPELFSEPTVISKVSGQLFIAERGNTTIMFNFGEVEIKQEIKDIKEMQLISSFGRGDPVIEEGYIQLKPRSCCILEK